jgi:hypothetical protein
MSINYTDQEFTTEQVADAAGCPAATFRQWRLRNQLFEETLDGSNVRKHYSLIDACTVRTVFVLSRFMVVDFAIQFAEGRVRNKIKALLEGRDVSTRIGFELHDLWNGQPGFSDDPGDDADELLEGTKGEVVLIDVEARIIAPVCKRLGVRR